MKRFICFLCIIISSSFLFSESLKPGDLVITKTYEKKYEFTKKENITCKYVFEKDVASGVVIGVVTLMSENKIPWSKKNLSKQTLCRFRDILIYLRDMVFQSPNMSFGQVSCPDLDGIYFTKGWFSKSITIEGCMVYYHLDNFPELINFLNEAIEEYDEHEKEMKEFTF